MRAFFRDYANWRLDRLREKERRLYRIRHGIWYRAYGGRALSEPGDCEREADRSIGRARRGVYNPFLSRTDQVNYVAIHDAIRLLLDHTASDPEVLPELSKQLDPTRAVERPAAHYKHD